MILDDDTRESTGEVGDPHGPVGTVAAPTLPIVKPPAPDGPQVTTDQPVLAMPTGPVPPSSSPARTALQAIVVLVAATLAGLVVFFAVKAAVSSDDDADVAQTEFDDETQVAPGPGDPGDDGRFGSKRSSIDGDSDSFVPGDPTAADLDTDADSAAERSDDPAAAETGRDPQGTSAAGPTATTDRASGAMAGPGNQSGLGVGAPTPPTSASGGGAAGGEPGPGPGNGPPPGPGPGASTAPPGTTPSATSPTGPPASTTTAPVSTTAPGPPTTPPLPADLIVAPSAGAALTWESPIRVQAAVVPGAKRYCWRITGVRSARSCSSDPTFELPGGRRNIGPGPVTLGAEARAGGKVLMSEKISLNLISRDFVKSPKSGATYVPKKRVRLSVRQVPTATRYCWSLSRGALSSGEICSADKRVDLPAGGATLAGIGPGRTTVEVVAYAGADVVGRQRVGIELTDR